MSTTSDSRAGQIVESLQDREYRELFVAEEIATGLPMQVLAMRRDRGWSQDELARRAGVSLETIQQLEQLDSGASFPVDLLQRLAAAFDVALVVRFEPYSRLVDWAANLAPTDMAVPAFDDDGGLQREQRPARMVG
ncbi:MAG: helix-turn-helix transcriptional regulator [Thermomicrobiales bacterium]